MKNTNLKIVFHYLPSGSIEQPSSAFSILKTCMQHNGYQVAVNYWNIAIFEMVRKINEELEFDIGNKDENLIPLFPFLYHIAESHNDLAAQKRVIQSMKNSFPEVVAKERDFFESYVTQTWEKISSLLQEKLKDFTNHQGIIHGFTARFDQWLSASVMAKLAKKITPTFPVIIGGFDSEEEALGVMKMVDAFDFAIWGEGEYPLKTFCEELQSGKLNFKNVNNLIYREKGKILTSNKKNLSQNNYFDLNSISADYNDYFNFVKQYQVKKNNIFISIENGRGCAWNKCNFCFLNSSYKYRMKNSDRIINEIAKYSPQHDNFNYVFTGTDITGFNYRNFENMLDKLIVLVNQYDSEFSFMAEVIPKNISEDIIKKMSILNFAVQVGYESISDSLLKRLNKISRFADLLLFIKRAHKHGLKIKGANILTRAPGEEASEVVEAINNLPFLRFFLGEQGFLHRKSKINIKSGSNFYKMLSESDKEFWTKNELSSLLPSKMLKELPNRFSVFAYFSKLTENELLWDSFMEAGTYFEKNKFYYKITNVGTDPVYREYCNEKLVRSLVFEEKIYLDILKAANNSIESVKSLKEKLTPYHNNLKEEKIVECLDNLSREYLVYYNKNLPKSIISIIETYN